MNIRSRCQQVYSPQNGLFAAAKQMQDTWNQQDFRMQEEEQIDEDRKTQPNSCHWRLSGIFCRTFQARRALINAGNDSDWHAPLMVYIKSKLEQKHVNLHRRQTVALQRAGLQQDLRLLWWMDKLQQALESETLASEWLQQGPLQQAAAPDVICFLKK